MIPFQTFGHRGCFTKEEINNILESPITIYSFDLLELSPDEIIWLPECEVLRTKYLKYKDDRYLDNLLSIYPRHALITKKAKIKLHF